VRSAAKLGLLFILTTLVLLPAAVEFPGVIGPFSNQIVTGPYVISTIIVFDVAVLFVAWLQSGRVTENISRIMAKLAVVSVLAGCALSVDERYSVIDIPIPHLLGAWLRVDGQYAYEADVFEIYCAIWVAIGTTLWASLALGLLLLRKCRIAARDHPTP
jgi:hypothetical protein